MLLVKGLGRGGAEQLLVSAAPYLDTTSFQYEVAYLLPRKDALVDRLETFRLPVHCLDGARGPGWMRRLRAVVREHEIDLVHSHSPFVGVGARMALRGKRLVHTEHNVWERLQRATYWGNLLTFFRNDHVFAVSEQVRASIRYPRILRFLRMPPVETLHHGLDPEAVASWQFRDEVREEFGLPGEAPVVGTVGNLTPKKQHRDLLDAAVKVRSEFPDLRVVLVGLGPLESALREQARRLGLGSTVIFAGFRDDVPRVVSAFDVFVLSSVHEGLPISMLEAMALGKPVVVTEVGGIREVVEHGKEGLIVPTGNPAALAEGILTLLRDASMRERFGEAGRRRAADFDIRSTVRRIEEVYEELLR